MWERQAKQMPTAIEKGYELRNVVAKEIYDFRKRFDTEPVGLVLTKTESDLIEAACLWLQGQHCDGGWFVGWKPEFLGVPIFWGTSRQLLMSEKIAERVA